MILVFFFVSSDLTSDFTSGFFSDFTSALISGLASDLAPDLAFNLVFDFLALLAALSTPKSISSPLAKVTMAFLESLVLRIDYDETKFSQNHRILSTISKAKKKLKIEPHAQKRHKALHGHLPS